jgi:hypothetical protein
VEVDDRDRPGRLLGGPGRGAAEGGDDVNVALHEVGGEGRESFDPAASPSSLDLQVSALDVAQVTQKLDEIAAHVTRPGGRSRAEIERPEPVHFPPPAAPRRPAARRIRAGQ